MYGHGYLPNMSPFELEVRVTAGTTLETAIYHAKYKTAELGMMYINFTFNGINFSISNKCNIDSLLEEYHRDVDNKTIKKLYIA